MSNKIFLNYFNLVSNVEEIKTLEKTAACHVSFLGNPFHGFNMQENSIVDAFMSGGHIIKLEIVCPYLKFPAKLRAETKARFCIVGETKQLSN